MGLALDQDGWRGEFKDRMLDSAADSQANATRGYAPGPVVNIKGQVLAGTNATRKPTLPLRFAA